MNLKETAAAIKALPDDDDEYYDDESLGCEWCGEFMNCWCEETLNCKCGAYFFGKDGKSHTLGDCVCGA